MTDRTRWHAPDGHNEGRGDWDGIEIRATHPAGFRSGEWAVITGLEWVRGRACYRVLFPDGRSDSWVLSDPSDPYEFRASTR